MIRTAGSAAGSLAAATTAAVPAGGFFAGGGDGLRVGVVGCGGRGTGAAIQAAAADPAVRITVLADLFADHIDSAAAASDNQAAGKHVRRGKGDGPPTGK